MVIPIIILVVIPIFLGLVFVSPFDQPEEVKKEVISKEPDTNIIYFLLMGIWTLLLIRILFKIKKGTFKATQKY
jgi:ABC-type thiamin/hydroxymethylpyrimidine transport system permease subunit